jgi:hypothetical protein
MSLKIRKTITFIFILALPFSVFASGNFSLWGGYSCSFMENANAVLDIVQYPQTSKTVLGSGITAGLDGDYWYYCWWGTGGRISYTQLFGGIAEGLESGLQAEETIGGSLLQLSAGVPFLFEFLDGKISAGGGIYAGWGLASVSINKTGGTSAGAVNAYGGCFVFEVPVRFTYHISSSFLLDLNLSWKSAYAQELFVRENSNYAGINYNKGERLYFRKSWIPEDPVLDMDFSGIMIGVGFNWRFSSKDWPWYNKKFSLYE